MTTTLQTRDAAPSFAAARPQRRVNGLGRRLRGWRADVILTVIAVETGTAVGLGVTAQPWSDWSTPHGALVALSRIAAMAGTALALVGLLLAARLPWIERAVGQDRLVQWHRFIGPYSLYLILAHIVFVTIGFTMADSTNVWSEWWNIILTMEWMVPALLGFLFMMMIGVTSWRRARSRMKYETWWAIHLYAYVGMALAFMHQVLTGAMFIGNPTLKNWWTLMYALTFGLIVWFRFVVPFISSLYHGFRVERVIEETHNSISVVLKGRRLDELHAQGGHFFGFRFMTRRYWWESHPYSLSASPRNDRLRITVKNLGDHSSWLKSIKPGTRVWVEGPYGVFTADAADTQHVTLIAGGVGVAPIRALLEELPSDASIDVIWRASTEADLMLRDEVELLVAERGGRVHYVVGSRQYANLDVRTLRELIPNPKHTNVFLCGPDFVVDQAIASCRALGVDERRIHHEAFAF